MINKQEASQVTISSPMIFISDVHIGAFSDKKEAEIERDLIGLVDYAEEHGYRISILGDLFDYWMEYPEYYPKIGQNILERFEKYNRSGQPCLYITGNHDNWVDHHFADLGFDVEPEYRILELDGKKFLLLHGDGVKEKNIELPRPLFHRLLRNPYFVSLYKFIFPPSAGIALTKWFSHVSRSVLMREEKECTVAIDDWAEKQLQINRFDVIICGHHHYPRYRNINQGLYVNLGNFFNNRTIAVYNNNRLDLVKWHGLNRNFECLFPD